MPLRMTDYDFTNLIHEPESEYLDFKQVYPENNAKLIHDILCLANAESENDRFLVFGVTDSRDVVGVNTDTNRYVQSQIIDLLRNSNLNCLPTIRQNVHSYQNKEVDVLCIGNRKEKPYFLLRDKTERGTTVRAGVVYTRAGDTNTPITSTADDRKIETMYRERLRIDASPIERLKVYLADTEKWTYTDDEGVTIFHYETFPEFTISLLESEQGFSEPWVEGFPDPSVWRYVLRCKYYGTKIHEHIAVSLDGGRILEVIPFQRAVELTPDNFRFYYYFKEETIEYLLHQMVRTVYPQNQRFYNGEPFNLFSENDDPKSEIEHHAAGNLGHPLIFFEKDVSGEYERRET